MSKRLEILEQALADMKATHRSAWDVYGSELCAGDMIRQEEELEKKIEKLRKEENNKKEDPKYIIDD